MARVVCVGVCVIDLVYKVGTLPSRAEKHSAEALHVTGGGMAANAAVTIARLGGTAQLVSQVGDDAWGIVLCEGCARLGVDVRHVTRLEGVPTSISTVLVDRHGERLLVNYMDKRIRTGARGLPDEAIATADALMVDTHWTEGALHALQVARTAGVPSVVDFDRPPPEGLAHRFVELASHVVFGRDGLTELSGEAAIEAGLRRVASRASAIVGVTAGADGVWWLEGEALRHVSAFPVEVVDTLAAGDVFHGALALALAERRDLAEAMRRASAAAALKCTRFGGREGIPSRDEVELLLGEQS
jgi:sulfofructose kinase